MCAFSQSTSLCMVADSHIPSCYWDREPTKSRSSGIFCFPTFFKCLSKYPHYSRMGFSLLMVSSPEWFLLLQSFIWLPMSTRCYCFWCCFYHVKYCSIFPVCVLFVFKLHTGNEAHNCLLVICLQPRRPVLFVGNHTMFGIYDSPILVHEVLCPLLPAVYFFTSWSAVNPATFINLSICLYSLYSAHLSFQHLMNKTCLPFYFLHDLRILIFCSCFCGASGAED